jgi:hypothetical protein
MRLGTNACSEPIAPAENANKSFDRSTLLAAFSWPETGCPLGSGARQAFRQECPGKTSNDLPFGEIRLRSRLPPFSRTGGKG